MLLAVGGQLWEAWSLLMTVHTCLLPSETRRGWTETAKDGGWFPKITLVYPLAWDKHLLRSTCFMTWVHPGARAAAGEEGAQLWGSNIVQTRHCIRERQWQPFLVLTQAVHQKWYKPLPVAGTAQAFSTIHASPCTSPTYSIAQFYTRVRFIVTKGRAPLWGRKVSQTQRREKRG